MAPQAIIGITVDFSSVFATFTPAAFIGWLIRALLLLGIGGFVSFLHRKETDPWRAFLIGLSAPALLSTLIAGTSHPGGAGIADRPETQSAFAVNGTAQAAMPPDVAPAARWRGATRGFALAIDTRSILPELTRGILGRRPALGFLAVPEVSRVRALADLSTEDRICATGEGLEVLARQPGPLRFDAVAMPLAELAAALRTGLCDAAVLVSQASPAEVAGYFAPVGIVAIPVRSTSATGQALPERIGRTVRPKRRVCFPGHPDPPVVSWNRPDPPVIGESPRDGRQGSPMAEDELQRKLLQQRAELADFGRRAAEGADLDQLLHDAADEVARSLGVSYVKVLEYLADEKSLLVRAGVGWGEGVVGQARIGADIASPAGYALQTGLPVIANDLDKEERFRIPDLLREHGVKSAVNVIIRSKQHIFGVLEADSRQPRVFSQDDVKFLQAYATILSFAIDQARMVEINAGLADEKTMLLRELGHRVRNNNQQLMSLINLQLGTVTNIEARDNLEKVAHRIQALTSVNQQLESSGRAHLVDLGQYLLAITGSLFNFQGESAAEVKLETEIAQVEIATERAQAIGLIVNEFLTNSFKHAFRDRGGVLTVRLSHDDRVATLALADDGPGMPDEPITGLGLKLIDLLCRQIDAEAAWQGDSGTRLTLQLPIRVA